MRRINKKPISFHTTNDSTKLTLCQVYNRRKMSKQFAHTETLAIEAIRQQLQDAVLIYNSGLARGHILSLVETAFKTLHLPEVKAFYRADKLERRRNEGL